MMQLQLMSGSNLDSQIFAMFAAGEKGAWYDPNDLSTLFQDSAGTTPVVAVGDPVGMMKDKSGNNRHMIQATSTARPILRQNTTTGKMYLSVNWDEVGDVANGLDDSMSCSSFSMTDTDQVTIAAGLRRHSDAAAGLFCELSAAIGSNLGAFNILAPSAAAANISFTSKGSASSSATRTTDAAKFAAHVIAFSDISADSSEIRVNDLAAVQAAADQGTGNFGNYTMYLFRRGGTTVPFYGRFNGLFVINRLCTSEELAILKAYYKERTGT